MIASTKLVNISYSDTYRSMVSLAAPFQLASYKEAFSWMAESLPERLVISIIYRPMFAREIFSSKSSKNALAGFSL